MKMKIRKMDEKGKRIHEGRHEAGGREEKKEDIARGTAAAAEVINVVLTRVSPQARRSQSNRRNEGQSKVWVKSNMIP